RRLRRDINHVRRHISALRLQPLDLRRIRRQNLRRTRAFRHFMRRLPPLVVNPNRPQVRAHFVELAQCSLFIRNIQRRHTITPTPIPLRWFRNLSGPQRQLQPPNHPLTLLPCSPSSRLPTTSSRNSKISTCRRACATLSPQVYNPCPRSRNPCGL